MGDIAPNFSRSEFDCPCGAEADPDPYLVAMLQAVRSHFNKPIVITSGYRTKEHNKKVGGAKKSYHLTNQAADFRVLGVTDDHEEIYNWCDQAFPLCGLKRYRGENRLHIDSRRAYWRDIE